jgi:phosphoglycerate dehydrogenase-like enzyme
MPTRPTRATPLRVHIANDPHGNDVFRVSPERFAAAARRHPAPARRLRVTFGEGLTADPGLAEAEVLVTGHFPACDLRALAPRLRWIQSTNAGVEDVLPVLPSDVVLTNASGVHGPKGAEFVITALLMLNHGLPHFAACQRERRWDPRFTTTIEGKTVVLIGVGAIGAEVARLARRFGLRVLGVRRSGQPHRGVDRMYRPAQLGRVLPEADFLVVTTPLTPESRGLIGRKELDCLPRHAGVVNIGRGAVIDNAALAEKLERGELGGAVLDVVDPEPLPAESPLWATPGLVITPHCAVDDGPRYVPRCLDIFFDNIRRYLAGRPLRNRIDPRRGY